MKYTVRETQHIVYEWTVEAENEDAARNTSLEGVPSCAVEARFDSEVHVEINLDAGEADIEI